MEVKTYEVYNPNARIEIDPGEQIQKALTLTNRVMAHIDSIQSELVSDYAAALTKRLAEAVQHPDVPDLSFNLDEMSAELPYLVERFDLQRLTALFVLQELGLPADSQPNAEKIEVPSLNHVRSISSRDTWDRWWEVPVTSPGIWYVSLAAVGGAPNTPGVWQFLGAVKYYPSYGLLSRRDWGIFSPSPQIFTITSP